MAQHHQYISLLVYMFLINILFLLCGIYVRKWTDQTTQLTSYQTSFMNNVAKEWQAPTLTALTTTNNTYCPQNAPDTVLQRDFFGSDLGCNCLGIYSKYITNQNQMIPSSTCTRNQTKYGCIQVKPIQPIRQGQFNGTRVCGQPNGPSFVNATRPLQTGCPNGTVPCSNFTSANQTICAPVGDLSSGCPITDIQLIGYSQLSSFNLNPANVASPLYYQLTYNSFSTLVYSKQAASLPVGEIAVTLSRPCMDSQIQTSNFYYSLELQRSYVCPTDVNSGLLTDPRYLQQSTAWQTNEYTVQQQNGVLQNLQSRSGYFYPSNVPNPALKQNVPLTAWTRSMSGWAIDCEWAFVGMNRTTAANYYSQEFGTTTASNKAHKASSGLLWFTVVFFSISFIVTLVLFFIMCSTRFSNAKETASCFIFIQALFGIAARIGWLITLSVMYSRINGSWKVVTENVNVAKNQQSFTQFSTRCGDPYAVLNADKALSYMSRARQIAKDSYWFTSVSLVFIIIELIVVVIYLVYLCCHHEQTQGQPAQTAVVVEMQKANQLDPAQVELQMMNQQNLQQTNVSPQGEPITYEYVDPSVPQGIPVQNYGQANNQSGYPDLHANPVNVNNNTNDGQIGQPGQMYGQQQIAPQQVQYQQQQPLYQQQMMGQQQPQYQQQMMGQQQPQYQHVNAMGQPLYQYPPVQAPVPTQPLQYDQPI